MSLIVERAQAWILTCPNKKTAVDATCGNGHDTVFLLQNFEEVYAFDIQPLAVKRTKERTEGYGNLRLFQEDFRKISNFVQSADAIMFNLGFLPGSNKKILTSDFGSAEAVCSAYKLLNEGGVMTVACYTEHPGGKEEFLKIKSRLEDDNISFRLEEGFQNNEILIVIKK